MYIVTGAAGFIGSALVAYLNSLGIENLILVDDFSRMDKKRNWQYKKFLGIVPRDGFFGWVDSHAHGVQGVFHLGARTDTTDKDWSVFERLNLDYSKRIARLCVEKGWDLVYASSAATYGLGEHGYSDTLADITTLKPLNAYGRSKQLFDEWLLRQQDKPPHWYGLKFFNVYGPNEYHKGRMASVIMHAFNQIKANKAVKLFRSHHKDYTDGNQLRDFIYVKDVCRICHFLMENKPASGIYNVGTGKAASFNELATATFNAMDIPVNITYIDTPIDIRDNYQYYTQADMQKLLAAGYKVPFKNLTEGATDYVKHYLMPNIIW